jgi:hypothetical protein
MKALLTESQYKVWEEERFAALKQAAVNCNTRMVKKLARLQGRCNDVYGVKFKTIPVQTMVRAANDELSENLSFAQCKMKIYLLQNICNLGFEDYGERVRPMSELFS